MLKDLRWLYALPPQALEDFIIRRTTNAYVLFKVFKMRRVNYGALFSYQPAITNEELL